MLAFSRTLIAFFFIIIAASPATAASPDGDAAAGKKTSRGAVEGADSGARAGRSDGQVSLSVDGISVHADDDAPRVLNIVPWQRPTVSKRTRTPLPLSAPALLEPVDPQALHRHRSFRNTLNPLAE